MLDLASERVASDCLPELAEFFERITGKRRQPASAFVYNQNCVRIPTNCENAPDEELQQIHLCAKADAAFGFKQYL